MSRLHTEEPDGGPYFRYLMPQKKEQNRYPAVKEAKIPTARCERDVRTQDTTRCENIRKDNTRYRIGARTTQRGERG
jgi:hypothetical protein